MKKRMIVSIAALIITGALSITGIALANASAHAAVTVSAPGYCVTFGHGPGAAGNYVLNNWDNSPTCPFGTYPHALKVGANTSDIDPFLPVNFYTADNHTATTWEITDGDTTWSCQYVIAHPDPPIPVNGDIAPTTQCTRIT